MKHLSLAATDGAEAAASEEAAAVPGAARRARPKAAARDDAGGVVKTAKRVLELFDFFAEHRRPLSVSDVVRGLGYPQSSTSALLRSLVKLGYLDYNRYTRLYMPTLRVALFGGWVLDESYTRANLSHLIDGLQRRAPDKTVMVGMQNEIHAQYIYMVQPHTSGISWYVKPGSLRPLCRSAVGHVLLSQKSDEEVRRYVWRINGETADPAQRVDVGELLQELAVVRERGYAYTEGTVHPQGGAIAVPMPAPPGQPTMALAVGGSIEMLRAERESILELLFETLLPLRQQVLDATAA